MLDIQQMHQKFTTDWADHVTVGRIVSFRFPVLRRFEEPAPCNKRPCLVLDCIESVDGPKVLLCYGTSAEDVRRSGYDIFVSRDDALLAGLRKITRFLGARRILVSLCNRGFVCNSAMGSPVIGSLDGVSAERMRSVRARFCAETDIARKARRQRRGASTRRKISFELRRPHRRTGQR